jgi:hypothetical protein
MKSVTIITKTNLYDEYYDDYPNFMGITLNAVFIKKVNEYRNALSTMTINGLRPYAIKEFDECMFIDPIELESKLSTEDTIAFVSDDTNQEWDTNFDAKSDDTITLNQLDRDCDFSADAMTLNVSTSGLTYRGMVKHCDIHFGSDVIGWDDFDKLARLITD